MKQNHKKIILYLIVILLTLTFIIQIVENTINGFPLSIFWACYIFMVLVSAGILFNKPRLILSQIAIMLIPSIIWMVDLIAALIIKEPLFGLVSNMFSNDKFYLSGMIYLYHGLIVPMAILAIAIMKPKKTKGYLKIAFIQIAILSILGASIPKLHGINCFPGPEICTGMRMQFFPLYPVIFLTILTISILLSGLAINYFLKKLN